MFKSVVVSLLVKKWGEGRERLFEGALILNFGQLGGGGGGGFSGGRLLENLGSVSS